MFCTPCSVVLKSRGELEAIYQTDLGLSTGDDAITYCRIGERSSRTGSS